MDNKLTTSDSRGLENLTPEQYAVTQKRQTEWPFSGKYLYNKEEGTYCCIVCKSPLFSSGTKFDTHCGWPNFWDVIDKDSVDTKPDYSHGMHRIEVSCRHCGAHLGHVFEDWPYEETGMRYCVNSAALHFQPREDSVP